MTRSTLSLITLGSLAALMACGPAFRTRDDTTSAGSGGSEANAAGSAPQVTDGGKTGAAGTKPVLGKAGESPHGGAAGSESTAGAPPQAGNGGTLAVASTSFGGAAGMGGSAGSGGVLAIGGLGGGGSGGGAARCMPLTLIDDMEDGNDRNCPNQQRNGEWWSATGTQTGTIAPPTTGNFPAYALGSEARGSSKFGMRLSGSGFGHEDADWASLGFNFIDDAAYDLSPYTGLAFYAKSRAADVTLHVELATNTTTALAEGGACQAKCNDHYSKVLTIDGAWREYSVPLAQLMQEGWGPQDKDFAHSRFVFFGVLGTDGGPAAFDFLIDDVRLY